MKRLLILTLALILWTLPALGAEAVITVTASGSVSLQPDYATVTLGAQTSAATVQEAQAENTLIIQAVLAAVKAQGVEEKDIATQSFYLTPVYDYTSDSMSVTGYRVENMLAITVRDLNNAAAVLDAGIAAGANQAYDISFGSSAQAQAQDEALRAAVQEGQRKAAMMAQAAGRTLGDLVSITEIQSSYPAYRSVKNLDAAAGAATPILSQTLEVTAGVEMTYTLQ
ncbi:MAG: SIMPL domain-containing protein [Clostridia bacterium]|nr:SIMPL domain-containing protein [Clostridia bacterium]